MPTPSNEASQILQQNFSRCSLAILAARLASVFAFAFSFFVPASFADLPQQDEAFIEGEVLEANTGHLLIKTETEILELDLPAQRTVFIHSGDRLKLLFRWKREVVHWEPVSETEKSQKQRLPPHPEFTPPGVHPFSPSFPSENPGVLDDRAFYQV